MWGVDVLAAAEVNPDRGQLVIRHLRLDGNELVIGPEMTARWFTERAGELGLKFLEPEPQQIYSISDRPPISGSTRAPSACALPLAIESRVRT